MEVEVKSTALMRYLKRRKVEYFAKATELRDSIVGWLSYVPQTFPHYTDHTIRHSERIIQQLSNLLFSTKKPSKIIVDLSPAEAYILVAAAYLHDAGMVVSDDRKKEILADPDWKQWTTGTGGAAAHLTKIELCRDSGEPANDSTIRNFAADIALRQLIAEFVRQRHHHLAADLIYKNQSELGRFAFDDGHLEAAIADVCVAHGLRREELNDDDRFPILRQIMGDNVNVRRLAILLRLGDLLDMDSRRACPLLLSAANPLPADSRNHWQQYSRIKHLAVSPRVIAIRAECENSEEHRLLRDWCQWIVDEVGWAPRLLANESAKEDWTPPRAELLGSRPTIVIRPAKGANYRPCDWRLELDQDQIFNRLIFGVHADRFAFIRELIQNALDATRCQMFDAHPGVATKNPANAPEDIRNRFPLTIALKAITIRNEAAQQDELRQVLAIEDRGTGMDEDIVRRYFLQIGRSYYQSGEFKQRYAFSPAGRFGIGFLSTLAASDHVRVETFRPSSPRGSEPLALTLTGPRNYIALEQGSRRVAGTRIEVRLLPDCELEPGVLTKKVRGWCRRVEFPIEVDDLGSKSVIVQERAADFVFQVPHPEHPDATLVLRAFDVDEAGIQGELYVLAKRLANGAEDWTETRDYKYEYPKVHPEATLPPLPRSLDCLHGIASFREPREAMIARLDVRRSNVEFDLSRSQAEPHTRERSELAIRKLWQEVLEEHLAHTPFAQGPAAWRYLNKLADDFPLGSPFWDSKTMIPLRRTGAEYLVSREQLNGITVLTEFSQVQRGAGEKDESGFDKIAIGVNPVDFRRLSDGHQESLFLSREPSNCRWVSRSHLAVDWTLRSQTSKSQMMTLTKHGLNEHFMCDLPRPDTVAFHIHRPLRAPGCILVNGRNALGRWYRSVVELTGKASWATESRVHALIGVLDRAATSRHSYIDELRRHLAGWESVKDLPGNLKPPLQMLTPESFDLRLVDGDI